MKICYCTLGFPPATGLGGPPLNAYYLTTALVARGHRVTVACSNLSNKREKLFPGTRRVLYDGVDVVYFNNYSLFPLGLHSFGLTIRPGFVSFFQGELKNYDIVHLDGYYSSDVLAGAYFCRKFNIPYVIQTRGTMTVIYSSLWAKHTYNLLFRKRILERCGLVIASSAFEASRNRNFMKGNGKVVIIPNGISVEDYARLPERGVFRQRQRIAEPKVIAYVGRVHASKGIDYLIHAYAVSRFRRESRLVVVGTDDGYKASLVRLTQQLGLADSVTFMDSLGGQEKLQVYVDSDAVVYAGRLEGESFGMVPFEAAMCGTPTITSKGGACAQLLTSFGAGFVVPYGDVRKLAQAIDGILANGQDADEKVRVAREKIKEHLSWEKIAQQYEEVYESVVRAHSGGSPGSIQN